MYVAIQTLQLIWPQKPPQSQSQRSLFLGQKVSQIAAFDTQNGSGSLSWAYKMRFAYRLEHPCVMHLRVGCRRFMLQAPNWPQVLRAYALDVCMCLCTQCMPMRLRTRHACATEWARHGLQLWARVWSLTWAYSGNY